MAREEACRPRSGSSAPGLTCCPRLLDRRRRRREQRAARRQLDVGVDQPSQPTCNAWPACRRPASCLSPATRRDVTPPVASSVERIALPRLTGRAAAIDELGAFTLGDSMIVDRLDVGQTLRTGILESAGAPSARRRGSRPGSTTRRAPAIVVIFHATSKQTPPAVRKDLSVTEADEPNEVRPRPRPAARRADRVRSRPGQDAIRRPRWPPPTCIAAMLTLCAQQGPILPTTRTVLVREDEDVPPVTHVEVAHPPMRGCRRTGAGDDSVPLRCPGAGGAGSCSPRSSSRSTNRTSSPRSRATRRRRSRDSRARHDRPQEAGQNRPCEQLRAPSATRRPRPRHASRWPGSAGPKRAQTLGQRDERRSSATAARSPPDVDGVLDQLPRHGTPRLARTSTPR